MLFPMWSFSLTSICPCQNFSILCILLSKRSYEYLASDFLRIFGIRTFHAMHFSVIYWCIAWYSWSYECSWPCFLHARSELVANTRSSISFACHEVESLVVASSAIKAYSTGPENRGDRPLPLDRTNADPWKGLGGGTRCFKKMNPFLKIMGQNRWPFRFWRGYPRSP